MYNLVILGFKNDLELLAKNYNKLKYIILSYC